MTSAINSFVNVQRAPEVMQTTVDGKEPFSPPAPSTAVLIFESP